MSRYDLRYPDTIRREAAGFLVERDDVDAVSHAHRKAELVHLISGNLTMESADGIWVVPPGRALWIPPGTAHSTLETGEVRARCIFFEPDLSPTFLPHCHLVFVHPLLEALLDRLTREDVEDGISPEREQRIVAVLLDELAAARTEPFHLPLPTDHRLKRIVQRLLERPSLQISIERWCAEIGTSPRTLSRLFRHEVGISFGKWRQQLHVQVALRELERGASVSAIAYALGYESASAFITMFKRNTGQTPGAEHVGRNSR